MSHLQQIADKLSISASTVSRALRNNPRISETTREKVLKEARRIGYSPDVNLSRAMKIMRSGSDSFYHSIACWWPGKITDARGDFFSPETKRVIESIRNACKERHSTCLFKHSDNLPENPSHLKRVLWNRGISGLLLLSGSPDFIPYEVHEDLMEMPLVSVRMNSINTVPSLIDFDYASAYQMVYEQIIDRGYERPGVIVRCDRENYYGERYIGYYLYYAAYLKVIRKLPLLEPKNLERPQFIALLKKWLERNRPDIIFSPYHIVKDILVNDLGYHIPGDFAYVGSGHTELDDSISCPKNNIKAIGYEAVIRLINKIENAYPDTEVNSVIRIKPDWHEGETMPRKKT